MILAVVCCVLRRVWALRNLNVSGKTQKAPYLFSPLILQDRQTDVCMTCASLFHGSFCAVVGYRLLRAQSVLYFFGDEPAGGKRPESGQAPFKWSPRMPGMWNADLEKELSKISVYSPGLRAFTWPLISSLWELHLVKGIRTCKGERKGKRRPVHSEKCVRVCVLPWPAPVVYPRSLCTPR